MPLLGLISLSSFDFKILITYFKICRIGFHSNQTLHFKSIFSYKWYSSSEDYNEIKLFKFLMTFDSSFTNKLYATFSLIVVFGKVVYSLELFFRVRDDAHGPHCI